MQKLLQQKESIEILEKKPKEPDIVDALNIVWGPSVVENNETNDKVDSNDDSKIENDKKLRNEKFRKQNSTITMLNRIGFSQKYAGPVLTCKINDYLARQLGPKSYRPMLHPTPALHSFFLSKQNPYNSLMETKV